MTRKITGGRLPRGHFSPPDPRMLELMDNEQSTARPTGEVETAPPENGGRGVDAADAPAAKATNGAATKPSEEEVYEALEEVIDPELGLDFVSLGLVYDVEVESGEVFVTFTLTTPACPIGPQVSEQMREFVGELDGVQKVHPKMVFDPPWSPEMMSEDAKFALGY
jgi:metal-sulfur cluster biosynthetic enzyme